MALLAEILENLLPKLGIAEGSDEFNAIIQNKGVAFDVPDKLKESLPNLLTVEEAKHNPALKAHYVGNSLDPINKSIESWLVDYGFSDDDAKAILSEKSTYKKLDNVINKIAQLKTSTTKGDDAELKKKLNDLNQMLSQAAQERENAVNAVRGEYEQRFTEQEIDALIGSKPLPGQFDAEVERKIAREFLNKKLAEKNVLVKRIDGKLKIVRKDNEEMFIFDNGKELDLDTLTNMALADNKFLKVNGGNGNPPPPPTRGGESPKLNTASNSALNNIDEMIKVVGG